MELKMSVLLIFMISCYYKLVSLFAKSFNKLFIELVIVMFEEFQFVFTVSSCMTLYTSQRRI